MLEVTSLSVGFGGVPAVDDVSFGVGAGETVGLIGPNGAGKTTVLNAISGLVRTSGMVALDGQELRRLSPNRRARLGMARTFQQPQIFDGQTICEHLLVAADHARNGSLGPAEAVALVGIDRPLHQRCNELNSHERVLVEIARALVQRPKLILLDEPAAGLLPHEVDDLLGLISRIHEHAAISILLIDHNMDLVLAAAERVHVLDFGKLLFSGAPEEIRSSKKVIDAYLGEAL